MNIEDLSYSKIVDIVQHEISIGGDILVEIALEKEDIDKQILDAEIKLQSLKTRELQLRKASLLVLKHLNRKTPLAVKRQDFIVVVSDSNISIEENVI